MSKGASSKPQLRIGMKDRIFTRIVDRFATSMGIIPVDPKKKFGLENLK